MSDEDRSGAGADGSSTAPGPLRDRAEVSLGMAKPRPDGRPGFTQVDVIAGISSLIWIIVVTLILVFARSEESVTVAASGFDGLRFVMTVIAVFLPVALIWVTAITVRWARVMREESHRLQAAVDAIRQGYLGHAQTGQTARSPLDRRVDELARAQRRIEEALAAVTALASERGLASAAAPEPAREGARDAGRDDVGRLPGSADQPRPAPDAAGAEPGYQPLPDAVLISALNFPESPEDTMGFKALRRALQHRQTGQLVQASQDVLTLLSQDGIYMDDLTPEHCPAALWRRFASGERGGEISELGGIRDTATVTQVTGRMRQDTIFRDAVHHFLRKFDQQLTAFSPSAHDAEIEALVETRSGRAFMLLARVVGAFD